MVNHGVPTEFITRLESEAVKFFSSPISDKENTGVKFFSSPMSDKENAGPPDPSGYGKKKIGRNGNIEWVEYILLSLNNLEFDYDSSRQTSVYPLKCSGEIFWAAVSDYVTDVKRMACEIFELMAKGLKIQPKNVFSRLVMDEESDSMLRPNHYPPCP
ncbi:PREDICTED: gibberellin 2-beta-dioxygenase 1-like [Ipomoea nil]|uniref:gibberellin 2-beta-dioxygenase 1-like n=1 Tax=Ipomoea nil TaxID=35883 RepID=UPI0009015200|nr:PREDICTED: gibberellin 2-beta-dioxygenase 1-like [Ipomoea nil]